MRVVTLVVCAVCLGTASGCGTEASAESVDGTLVLELGGSNPSLREALRKRGIVIAPPEQAESRAPVPKARPLPVPPSPAQRPDPEPAPAPPPTPEPAPPPQLPWFVVELQPGENLTVLARRHLGNGDRYREIQQLNGWSERQLSRLPIGTKVKIPRER